MEIAEPDQSGRHDVFRHGLGVHPLPARPDPVVVEVVEERLDTGVGQLHPFDPVGRGEDLGVQVGPQGVGPHEDVGLAKVDHVAARGPHRFGECGVVLRQCLGGDGEARHQASPN